jgi:hypothetical protein
LSYQVLELAMNEVTRLCELEAECRLRALSEPGKKWYWLAQAAKYQVQASQTIAFRFEKPATARTPEVKLKLWSHRRDQRRSMEALPLERRTG